MITSSSVRTQNTCSMFFDALKFADANNAPAQSVLGHKALLGTCADCRCEVSVLGRVMEFRRKVVSHWYAWCGCQYRNWVVLVLETTIGDCHFVGHSGGLHSRSCFGTPLAHPERPGILWSRSPRHSFAAKGIADCEAVGRVRSLDKRVLWLQQTVERRVIEKPCHRTTTWRISGRRQSKLTVWCHVVCLCILVRGLDVFGLSWSHCLCERVCMSVRAFPFAFTRERLRVVACCGARASRGLCVLCVHVAGSVVCWCL